MVRCDQRSETENASMPLKPAAFLAACLVLFTPLTAIAQDSPAQNSTPATLPVTDTVPVAQDIPYPGTMRLMVDATDTVQNIFKIRQIIPVGSSGPMTLLYPERSEEHTSELQSLMRISYAVFCLKNNTTETKRQITKSIVC